MTATPIGSRSPTIVVATRSSPDEITFASTTERRSSSLPTQQNTMSAPAAASRGVGAARPLNSATQACALAALRL